MSQEIRESYSLLFKRASQASLGVLIFMLVCSFLPGTNAWVDAPFNSYWLILLLMVVIIFAGFFGGALLFNKKKSE